MHQRMDRIINDWSTKKDQFLSTNAFSIPKYENSVKGNNDYIYLLYYIILFRVSQQLTRNQHFNIQLNIL